MLTLSLRHEHSDGEDATGKAVRVWVPGKGRVFEQLVQLRPGEESSFNFDDYTEMAFEEVAVDKRGELVNGDAKAAG